MSLVLDPVWPWSRLWEALQQVPPALRVVAAMAAAAAFALPLLHFARSRTHWRASTASVVLMSLLLVGQHTWSYVYSGCLGVTGSGFPAFFLALGAHLALFLLLIGPPALAGLSAATYLGTPGLTRRRLAAVITLRLLAFLLTLIAIARPSLGWSDEDRTTTQLFLLLDHSRSMTVQDERGKQSRWELLQKTLEQAQPALARLRDEQQVEVKVYRFADELHEAALDDLGPPDGKRTDAGAALRALFDRRDGRVALRGVLLVGDGADNGGTPALAEATRWRGAGTALSTFACGNPGTTAKENDIAVTAISTSPSPFVPMKGKLTVKLAVDARGYENTRARVRLFLEADGEDREVLAKDVPLPLTTGNEVTLVTDAPAKPGEVKVKAVVESPEPDHLPLNNTIETFVTVSKEGISVLLVDRSRAFEPQLICDALSADPRIRVTPVWVRGGRAPRLRLLDEQPFDVILLGDVTLAQLRSLDPDAPAKIRKQVERGAGLMVLGGYVNLGNGNWQGSELERLLPVDLDEREQIDKPVRMVPTEDGLRRARYVLRLDDHPDLHRAWATLAKLDGMTVLKLPAKRTGLELVLAETEDRRPLLVTSPYGGKPGNEAGAARVLVFGGDTTYRWVRGEEGQRLHERFWRQVVVWLARQEDAEGTLWVRPDVRRLPVRSELGFAVGLRGKGGGPDVRDGKFEVEVVGPDGTRSPVPLMRSPTQTRGVFGGTKQPGVYRITVKGEGKDPSGGVVSGESSARVIVYDEDVEMARPAADPEFLKKLAAAGGGEALRVEQLADYLNRLAEQPLEHGQARMELRPDWRTTSRSPFLVWFFVTFCVVVSLEWGLRRRWGMV
ncbi:MAG: hypothetical protein U0797_01105 [Gemmataceae bacterium]